MMDWWGSGWIQTTAKRVASIVRRTDERREGIRKTTGKREVRPEATPSIDDECRARLRGAIASPVRPRRGTGRARRRAVASVCRARGGAEEAGGVRPDCHGGRHAAGFDAPGYEELGVHQLGHSDTLGVLSVGKQMRGGVRVWSLETDATCPHPVKSPFGLNMTPTRATAQSLLLLKNGK